MPLVKIADLATSDDDTIKRMIRATNFATEYDQFICNEKGDAHKRRPGIHASEASNCKRRIVYSCLATPRKESINKNWRQRFQVGHAIHGMLQRDFHNMAKQSGGLLTFQDEVKIAPEIQEVASTWFLNSSCDGLFTFRDTPGGPPVLRMLVEIKTASHDEYDKIKAPKSDHIDQAHIYMKALDVPLMWFFYINKSNQNNTDTSGPFLVRYDAKVWDKLAAKFTECFEYAEREELPPKEESMVCQFCAFSYTCMPTTLSGTYPNRRVVSLKR